MALCLPREALIDSVLSPYRSLKQPIPPASLSPLNRPKRRDVTGGGGGGVEEQRGLRCGEANLNQGMGGTSGQGPNAGSQRQK